MSYPDRGILKKRQSSLIDVDKVVKSVRFKEEIAEFVNPPAVGIVKGFFISLSLSLALGLSLSFYFSHSLCLSSYSFLYLSIELFLSPSLLVTLYYILLYFTFASRAKGSGFYPRLMQVVRSPSCELVQFRLEIHIP